MNNMVGYTFVFFFVDLTQEFLGEIRMTPIFAFAYGISFAAIAAVIVHTVLYEGNEHYSIFLIRMIMYL